MPTLLQALRQKHYTELSSLVGTLDLNDKQQFYEMMTTAFCWYGLSAAQLAKDQHLSKCSVSRWVNGLSCPTNTTRKAVRSWIKNQLAKQIASD